MFLPISDWPLLIQATYSLTFDTLTGRGQDQCGWIRSLSSLMCPPLSLSLPTNCHTLSFFSIFPTTLQLGKWKILSIKSCSEGFWSDKMIAEMSNIFVQLVYLLKLFSLVLQKYLVAYHQQPILFVYLQLINCLRMPPVPWTRSKAVPLTTGLYPTLNYSQLVTMRLPAKISFYLTQNVYFTPRPDWHQATHCLPSAHI